MAESKYYTLLGVRFFPRNLRGRNSLPVVVDLAMLFLVSVNILLFIFWWVYGYYRVSHFVELKAPEVHAILGPLYREFPLIDLIFVSIFLGEFTTRWIIAIVKKRYHRWFFFPFIYWYDLLGSIPFGSFRFLRFLRIFALLSRLQKMEVLDLRHTYFYTRVRKYRAILMEEISDRVVLNVLSGVQDEVKAGLPLTDRILQEVIQPYKPVLTQWLSQRLQQVTRQSYAQYQDELKVYVDQKIEAAVAQNKEITQIGEIPLLGPRVADMLERAIQDIVFNVVHGLLKDLSSGNHARLLDEFSDITLETILHEDRKPENNDINTIVRGMAVEALAVVKKHVEVQEWKLREQAEQEGLNLVGHALMDPEEAEEWKKGEQGEQGPS